MYKVLRELTPTVFNEIFEVRQHNDYNLRHVNDFVIQRKNSVNCNLEVLAYLGPKTWDIAPQELKKID